MLVDIYRGLRIMLKFIFYDFWKGTYNFLVKKQNNKIKATYDKRIQTKRNRL